MRPTELPGGALVALADAQTADWLEARARAALLFWDPDDAASQRQRARVEVVAAAAGVEVGTIDVRAHRLVAQALGVKSVPTLVVFRAGDEVDRVMGGAPEPVVREALG